MANRWLIWSALVVGAVITAPASVHAGACAPQEIPTRALTRPGAELAKGGGVVVAMESAAKAPAMTFGKTAAVKTVIGAGLVMYSPPAGTGSIALQLNGKDLVRVRRAGDLKVVAAPKLGAVTYYSSTSRRGMYVSLAVEIAGALPPGIVAVAVFDDNGTLRSWGDVSEVPPPERGVKTQQVNVYASGSCVVQPDGFAPSAAGDKVQVAYIDASGRISAKTAAIVVAAPPSKDALGI